MRGNKSPTLFCGDTGTVEGNVWSTLFYLLFDRSGSYSPLSAGVSGVFLVINCLSSYSVLSSGVQGVTFGRVLECYHF